MSEAVQLIPASGDAWIPPELITAYNRGELTSGSPGYFALQSLVYGSGGPRLEVVPEYGPGEPIFEPAPIGYGVGEPEREFGDYVAVAAPVLPRIIMQAGAVPGEPIRTFPDAPFGRPEVTRLLAPPVFSAGGLSPELRSVPEVLGGLVGRVKDAATSAVSTIWDALKAVAETLLDTVRTLIDQAIPTVTELALGIARAAKNGLEFLAENLTDAVDLGKQLALGIAVPFEALAESIGDTFAEPFRVIFRALLAVIRAIMSRILNIDLVVLL